MSGHGGRSSAMNGERRHDGGLVDGALDGGVTARRAVSR
jgi:hypothetical protein